MTCMNFIESRESVHLRGEQKIVFMRKKIHSQQKHPSLNSGFTKIPTPLKL